MRSLPPKARIQKLIDTGRCMPLATKNYPSRGQTAVQELYQTQIGKLFLKRVSERNHRECQINVRSGTLAEREWWAYRLAMFLGLQVPPLALLDDMTTVQLWIDLPDGRQYKSSQGVMTLSPDNVASCALFDWMTGQVDRHDANYLYNMATRHIMLIDSGHAFLKYDGSMPDYLYLYEAGNAQTLQRPLKLIKPPALSRLTAAALRKLVPLRDHDEAGALEKRVGKIAEARFLQDVMTLYRG